ncbi:hypothetical protein [Coleofasciculus sp. FACHB-1120]|uniref:hypothetical protein n=1 Tax=Coleofasciculus sp. FACHB-1120 TaxID=2692783 RepID=UPI0016893406|nr:hypothetical protein [Coleofasciculus sp. FACHB-1120]MBD2741739.1 hypothetical protein [Coleofasciculus sp. FACHB-1120]
MQELPPLYTRLLAGSISLLVFGAIAWAHYSQVDEVAVAPGDIDCLRIKKGDILIERDPDLPQAEVDRLATSTQLIREELGRLQAERTGGATAGTALQDQLLTARLQDFEAKRAGAIAEANRQIAVVNEAKVRLTRLQENLANAKINLVNAETNLANSKSLLNKANSSLALAEKREKALTTLLIPGAFPRLDYMN